MSTWEQAYADVLRYLERARALDGIEVVADLYAEEIDAADRCLWNLLQRPDHVTGSVPAEVMREIRSRCDAAWAVAS